MCEFHIYILSDTHIIGLVCFKIRSRNEVQQTKKVRKLENTKNKKISFI